MVHMQGLSPAVEAYWAPGCSSCLRMKEFLEKHAIPFRPINVAENPQLAENLKKHGLGAPAVVVGDKAVPGLDLKAIAKLVGFQYEPPKILPPAVLKERYEIITGAVIRITRQLSAEHLRYKSPDRDRTLAELIGHVGSIMRAFLYAYKNDTYDDALEVPTKERQSEAELTALLTETEALVADWWKKLAYDDPMDRIIETGDGVMSIHEMFERAVWHCAQHTRQLAYFAERLGIRPDRPLSAKDLEGLPLPEGIHAGND